MGCIMVRWVLIEQKRHEIGFIKRFLTSKISFLLITFLSTRSLKNAK